MEERVFERLAYSKKVLEQQGALRSFLLQVMSRILCEADPARTVPVLRIKWRRTAAEYATFCPRKMCAVMSVGSRYS